MTNFGDIPRNAGVPLGGLKDNDMLSKKIAPSIFRARASADKLSSTTIGDIPGATVTFTPAIATLALVIGIFDFKFTQISGDPLVQVIGTLDVDGVEQAGICGSKGVDSISGTTRGGTMRQTWLVPLTAAAHTLKLRVRSSASAGGDHRTLARHTQLIVIPFASGSGGGASVNLGDVPSNGIIPATALQDGIADSRVLAPLLLQDVGSATQIVPQSSGTPTLTDAAIGWTALEQSWALVFGSFRFRGGLSSGELASGLYGGLDVNGNQLLDAATENVAKLYPRTGIGNEVYEGMAEQVWLVDVPPGARALSLITQASGLYTGAYNTLPGTRITALVFGGTCPVTVDA